MLVDVTVQVSKETYELSKGVAELTKAVKLALKDGFQVGQDIPPIITAAIQQLAAIEGVELIDDEMKENPEAFAKAVALGLGEVYGAVKA